MSLRSQAHFFGLAMAAGTVLIFAVVSIIVRGTMQQNWVYDLMFAVTFPLWVIAFCQLRQLERLGS